MAESLRKARNNFLNFYSWQLIHGLTTKTNAKCEQTCSQLFWKDYCCATVKMTHKLENGQNFFKTENMCLNREITRNKPFTFEKKVGFTVECNQAMILMATSVASSLTYFLY